MTGMIRTVMPRMALRCTVVIRTVACVLMLTAVRSMVRARVRRRGQCGLDMGGSGVGTASAVGRRAVMGSTFVATCVCVCVCVASARAGARRCGSGRCRGAAGDQHGLQAMVTPQAQHRADRAHTRRHVAAQGQKCDRPRNAHLKPHPGRSPQRLNPVVLIGRVGPGTEVAACSPVLNTLAAPSPGTLSRGGQLSPGRRQPTAQGAGDPASQGPQPCGDRLPTPAAGESPPAESPAAGNDSSSPAMAARPRSTVEHPPAT